MNIILAAFLGFIKNTSGKNMIYRLIYMNGEDKGRRVTVDTAPMTLGRDPDCAIRIPDDEVSRKHAVLEHKPAGLMIRDLGSMNRILVNNREVRERRLKHGDVIEIGRTKLLVQAVVQAEITMEGAGTSRVRDLVAVGLILVVLLVLVGSAVVMFWKGAKPVIFDVQSMTTNAGGAPASSALVGVAQQADGVEQETAPEAAGAVEAPPVTEELRHLQEALADIRESVRQLAEIQSRMTNAPPPPAQPPALEAAPAAVAASPGPDEQALMEESRQEAALGHWAEADHLLERLQTEHPDFLPAYEERASQYEQRGLLEKAIGQWLQAIQRSEGTALHEKAVSERDRLGKAEAAQFPATFRQVRIAAVEQHKFRESDDFDEMRILNIGLVSEQAGKPVDTNALRVDVLFYDADETTGAIVPTAAVTPRESLQAGQDPAASDVLLWTATYVAPKGFREAEAAAGHSRHYYGYRVQVYCNEVLQDEKMAPTALAQRVGSPAPEEAVPPAATNAATGVPPT